MTTAPDGMLAWRLLQQSSASYGLVITDFIMPRMTRIELLEKIRAAYPWIQIVLVTGHGQLGNTIASRAQQMAAFAVLPKPCGFEQLHGIIRQALVRSSATEGPV